jgi:hypothetical protein
MSFDWHIRFLEEKSFPRICDTPRFEVKQLLLTKITNKNHGSAKMPSKMVGWQCLYCTFINEDASGACIMCQKAHPKRRLIVAEEAVAAAEAEPEAAAVAVAQGGSAPADDKEDDIPLPVTPSTEVCGTKTEGKDSEETKRAVAFSDVCDLIKKNGHFMDPNLVGSSIKIVGINELQCGRSCNDHVVCGQFLKCGSYVCFCAERFNWRGDKEEDVISVYRLKKGVRTCKVGYLPKHLAVWAHCYDGLCARVSEVYSGDILQCASVAKRQKHHRKEGCCLATIEGLKKMFVL